MNEYASIQIEAQYFEEIDLEVRAAEGAHNVFRPGERDMLDVIEALREIYNKNKSKFLNGNVAKNKGEDSNGNKIKESEDGGGLIEVDFSGVESKRPNGLVIGAGVLLLLIACVTVFVMASRRNASVQRLSVVIKERFSNLDNGNTIKVKKTVCNNTVDVIDGQAVVTETDRAPEDRLRLKKQAKSAYDKLQNTANVRDSLPECSGIVDQSYDFYESGHRRKDELERRKAQTQKQEKRRGLANDSLIQTNNSIELASPDELRGEGSRAKITLLQNETYEHPDYVIDEFGLKTKMYGGSDKQDPENEFVPYGTQAQFFGGPKARKRKDLPAGKLTNEMRLPSGQNFVMGLEGPGARLDYSTGTLRSPFKNVQNSLATKDQSPEDAGFQQSNPGTRRYDGAQVVEANNVGTFDFGNPKTELRGRNALPKAQGTVLSSNNISELAFEEDMQSRMDIQEQTKAHMDNINQGLSVAQQLFEQLELQKSIVESGSLPGTVVKDQRNDESLSDLPRYPSILLKKGDPNYQSKVSNDLANAQMKKTQAAEFM